VDIHHADYSARLALEELVLLEDHCRRENMRCKQCCRKHLTRACAYAAEARALDGATAQHDWLAEQCESMRSSLGAWAWLELAGAIRDLRRDVNKTRPDWLE
jgi:hypothetical protein